MIFVAFDLDDTLYKEEDYVHSAYRAIADKMPQFPLAFSTMMDARKRGENAFDALMDSVPDLSISDLLNTYRYHIPTLSLSADAKSLLNSLRDRGVVIAIITDGRSESQRNKIKALGLSEYVDEANILISEEFGSDKHNVDNFKYFADKYPSCDKFYYIGDNPAKDFYNPNILGWTTIQLDDDGRNIHSQDIDADVVHNAHYHIQLLVQAKDIIIGNIL